MKKLKDLLNESQHLDYRRINVGEEKEKGMTNEEKRAFVEAVSAYRQFGEMISHKGNLSEIHESIKGIVENANKVTIKETGDWFDKVTVGRHMKSMNESFKIFSNTIKEVNTLQQRLESTYDEIGEVLGKYYEIKEGNEFGANRAKAIAAGDDSFDVDGKEYKVTSVDKEDKENAKDFAKESVVTEKTSMKLTNILNEGDKWTLIDPKGNSAGTGMKAQVVSAQTKKGGEKNGFFVVPAKSALKARRALEKFKGDFKNAKLKDYMSALYFDDEMFGEAVINESPSSEELRIVLMAVKKLGKYRNVPINQAVVDVQNAADQLQRDIAKGKIK